MENLNCTKLLAALINAKKSFKQIKKNKEAKAGSFSYQYADLAEVMDSVNDALLANGLVVSQSIFIRDGDTLLASSLYHSSGENIVSYVPVVIPERATSQQLGAALTYSRRYGISCLLSLVVDDDTDGVSHQGYQAPKNPNYGAKPAQDKPMGSPSTAGMRAPISSGPRTGPTEKQLYRLFAIAKNAGLSKDQTQVTVRNMFGIPETQLSREQYDLICSELEGTKSQGSLDQAPPHTDNDRPQFDDESQIPF